MPRRIRHHTPSGPVLTPEEQRVFDRGGPEGLERYRRFFLRPSPFRRGKPKVIRDVEPHEMSPKELALWNLVQARHRGDGDPGDGGDGGSAA